MLNAKMCKSCRLPHGARGVLEEGEYISDVQFYSGRGTMAAKPVQVQLGEDGVCNICNLKKGFFKNLVNPKKHDYKGPLKIVNISQPQRSES